MKYIAIFVKIWYYYIIKHKKHSKRSYKHCEKLWFSMLFAAAGLGFLAESALHSHILLQQTAYGASPILEQTEILRAVRPEKKQSTKNEDEPMTVTPITRENWRQFLLSRSQFQGKTVKLRLPEELREEASTEFEIDLDTHAHWILHQQSEKSPRATLDPLFVTRYIEKHITPLYKDPSHAVIHSLPQDEGVVHAEVNGIAQDGWQLLPTAIPTIIGQIADGALIVDVPLEKKTGQVIGPDGSQFYVLAEGVSDFSGSVPNRVFNVQKALNEHVSNIYVPQGASLAFNDSLGGRVDVDTGWKLSMGIFENGQKLELTPGGGICQASTTLYRAVAAAGLPILEQKNHSMYINYYRKKTEGLDATIYPGPDGRGGLDLVFENDTPGDLLVQAYADEDHIARVRIYSSAPPDRTVFLEGPYRKHDAPADLRKSNGYRLNGNEIAWRQHIFRDSGTIEQNVLTSRYVTEIPWQAPAEQIEEREHMREFLATLVTPSLHSAATEHTQDSQTVVVD